MSPQHELGEVKEGIPLFSFGVVADVQYADEDNKLSVKKTMRYYREALPRLREAVQHWNSCPKGHQVNFLLQLGDVIDGLNRRKGESKVALDRVLTEMNAFKGVVHHTWGNHELYNFPREELLQMCLNSAPADEATGAKTKSYYFFSPHPSFIVIMLDTYNKSMLGYHPEHPVSKESEAFLRSVNRNADLNDSSGLEGVDKRHSKFNGAIDEAQLRWLDKTLADAQDKGQKVLICGHQPIHPESCEPKGMCWNYERVLSVIHQYSCVCVYVCGHDHAGGMHRDEYGMLHLTLPGLVEAHPGENDFGTVHVYADRMVLHGHGRVPNMTLAQWGP